MATSSVLLLSREYHALKKRPCSNWFQVYDLNNDKIHEWIVFVIGPPATLFEGGIYRGLLRFPEDYPMSPPSLQFTSEVFHPNIYRDGKVCLSTLQVPPPDEPNPSDFWRPVLGVEQALLSVVSLLSDPNLDDPANPDAASMLRDEPSAFKRKVHDSAVKSRTAVPEDFEMPVVVPSYSTARSSAVRGSAKGGGKRLGTGYDDVCDEDEEDEDDEYVYSDDEWEFENEGDDNEAYSVAGSSSSLVRQTSATSAKSSKSSKSAKKKDKKKKEEKKKDKKDKKEKETQKTKDKKTKDSSTSSSSGSRSSTRRSSSSSKSGSRRGSRSSRD
jgi:ubiquitin-protein ligase